MQITCQIQQSIRVVYLIEQKHTTFSLSRNCFSKELSYWESVTCICDLTRCKKLKHVVSYQSNGANFLELEAFIFHCDCQNYIKEKLFFI